MPDPAPMQQASPTIAPPQPQVQGPVTTTDTLPTTPATSLPGQPEPAAPEATGGVPVTAIAPVAPLDITEAPAPRMARVVPRTATPIAAPTAAPAPQPEAAVPVDTIAVAPSEPTVSQPAAPIAAAPTQAGPDTTKDEGSNGKVWGWLAALLAALGVGGGAIALRRSRTREAASMPASANALIPDRIAHPNGLTTSAPAIAAAPTRFDTPVMHTASGPAPAPRGPQQKPAMTGEQDIDQRLLDCMIAQRPSRENPFVTRANRKRRALFLLRNRYPMQSAA